MQRSSCFILFSMFHLLNNSLSFSILCLSFQLRGLFKKYREFWISAGYVYSIFNYFVALCWYSFPSLIPTRSAILNVQLIFYSYFVWTCFGSSSTFACFKKGSKHLYQIFRVERSIRNTTYKLCPICAKQFSRNARICGRTKIDFCTVITPLLTHRCLCANFWPKTTQ